MSAPTLLLVLLTVQMQMVGKGYIVKTRLLTNQKTCTARFRLSFYHTAPSPVNDNAPKPMLYANKDKLIGSIDLDPCNTEGTSSDAGLCAVNCFNAIRLCSSRYIHQSTVF